jgi:tRNA nucleotidyltransferase/poly(A) polymerase
MNIEAEKAIATLFGNRRVLDLLDILNGEGEETRIVGGAVRNALIGLPTGDIDLATTALPPSVIARAKAAGFKPVPTGIEHGTVTVVVRGHPFEVTTLREDIATYGRRAIVRFGRDFAEDARRRDFTVNAFSVSADRALHDPVGGLNDLEAGRIRFIGDPRQRIREDYLRILRFFRFHAAYGEGQLDRAGLDAAIAEREGLAVLSAERIRAEMMKFVLARRAGDVAQEISDAGFFERIFSGIAYPVLFARLAQIGRTADDAVLRLGALAVCVREDADRLRERLRLSNAEHKRLAEMADARIIWRNRESAPEERDLQTQLFLRGRVCSAFDSRSRSRKRCTRARAVGKRREAKRSGLARCGGISRANAGASPAAHGRGRDGERTCARQTCWRGFEVAAGALDTCRFSEGAGGRCAAPRRGSCGSRAGSTDADSPLSPGRAIFVRVAW